MATLNNINELCQKLVPPNSKVLDLGCADGSMGKNLEIDLNCQVTGVEINPYLANKAKKNISYVITGDIQKKNILKEIANSGKFDIILAMAILEHLQFPKQTITQLIKYLSSDGLMIISLPNIAHWSIRLSLIRGKFTYQNSGILDLTHLRFFTLKTAVSFIEKDCRLKIKKVEYEFTKLAVFSRLMEFIPGGTILENMLFRKFPGFFAYQFLFLCTKP